MDTEHSYFSTVGTPMLGFTSTSAPLGMAVVISCEGRFKMKLPRRQFLYLAATAAALSAVSDVARAQSYPTRPVRIIVGAAPSGTYDIMARLIGQWLSERLGQPFVIENRPGAGTTIGTEAVVKAPPDGLYAPACRRSGRNQRAAL